MGLPMTCAVVLGLTVMGGFIASGSLVWLVVSTVIGYAILRALAAFDPRLFDVLFVSLRQTPLPPGWFKGRGIIYRA